MIPTATQADAAIVVMDERNIAEAIKPTITTATKLDQQTKQLLLDILNTKTLTVGQVEKYVQSSQQSSDNICGTGDMLEGFLKKDNSVENFYMTQIGNVEGILNGNITLADIYMNYQNGVKAANAANMDAAKIAKQAQEQTVVEAENLEEAVQDSAKAEGQLQAIQAGNQINAIATRTAMRNSNSLGGLIAMMSTKLTREAVEEAYFFKQREDTLARMKAYYDN